MQRRLDLYDNSDFDPGGNSWRRVLWYFASLFVFESGWMPLLSLKCWLLRKFGATIGHGVVIKPHVRIKYPWNLSIGDHVWIGEEAWIDNLVTVTIHSHAVLSQGAYLCTGSHNHRVPTFDLVVKPIVIQSGVWVCARAVILPGVTLGENCVIAAGCVVERDVPQGAMVRPAAVRCSDSRSAPNSSSESTSADSMDS